MKKFVLMLLCVQFAFGGVWINEVNYDDEGGDDESFIELCGNATVNITGWEIQLYNGNDGELYDTHTIGSFTIANETNGFGFFVVAYDGSTVANSDETDSAGIQNGGPDAIRLVNDSGTQIHMIEYEGTRSGGYDGGVTPDQTNIGSDSGTTTGESLSESSATGDEYSDFTWSVQSETPGTINVGQGLIPEPATFGLIGLALLFFRYLIFSLNLFQRVH